MERVVVIIFVSISALFISIIINHNSLDKHFVLSAEAPELAAQLIQAIDKGDIEAATETLLLGADANTILDDGNTILHKAVLMNNATLTKLLTDFRANPSIKNSNGETAHGISLRMNNRKIIEILKVIPKVSH